jgi:hypothetical protein
MDEHSNGNANGKDIGEGEVDRARRRLLKIAAYATPFLLTFTLPDSSWADGWRGDNPGHPHWNSKTCFKTGSFQPRTDDRGYAAKSNPRNPGARGPRRPSSGGGNSRSRPGK